MDSEFRGALNAKLVELSTIQGIPISLRERDLIGRILFQRSLFGAKDTGI
jgi:hypothetical protein